MKWIDTRTKILEEIENEKARIDAERFEALLKTSQSYTSSVQSDTIGMRPPQNVMPRLAQVSLDTTFQPITIPEETTAPRQPMRQPVTPIISSTIERDKIPDVSKVKNLEDIKPLALNVETKGEGYNPWNIEGESWWQKGLSIIGKPFDLVQDYAFTPLAVAITTPGWAKNKSFDTNDFFDYYKSLLPAGERREAYESWDSPMFVKGALEFLPWLLTPSALGIAGRLTGIAGKIGRLSPIAKAAAKAIEYSPYGLAEKGVGKATSFVAKSVLPKKTYKLVDDLQDFDEVMQVASEPDKWRQLAQIPAVKGIAKLFGGQSATATTPAEWALVGRAMLRQEGETKAVGILSSLERIGRPQKLFNTGDDLIIKSGGLKGKHLESLLESKPEVYSHYLTKEQSAWVKQAQEIQDGVTDFVKRNGIDINELSFEEGGRYFGRKVYAKINPDGELIDAAYVGGGVGRVGGKAGFEKARSFKTVEEALENGYKYLPPDEALYYNTIAAYNRVADKNMSEWLLERVPWRTTGAPEELVIAAESASRKLGKAKKAQEVLNRAMRGEKIPEQTVRSIESAFPELNFRVALSSKELMSKARKPIKELIKLQSAESSVVKSARAKAREKAMRSGFDESMVGHPAFAGKVFIGADARVTADTLRRGLDQKFSSALHSINQANSVGRYFALAGDMSPFTIQLLFLAGANPKAYGKALYGFVRSFFDRNFHSNYLTNHLATINKSPNLMLSKGGTTEFTEAMARGGFLRRKPFSIGGKVLEPFQRGFETAIDVAGIEMREAFEHLATTPAARSQVEAFINEFRGLLSTKRLGISMTQRQLETAVVLAPKYNRAIAALVGDLFRGNIRGQLARQSMAKGITAISAMTVAVSLALGEDEDEIVEHLTPSSSKFMTWNIAGQNIGPGSKVRSLLKTAAQAIDKPENLFKLSMENPNLRFVRGNLAPAVSTSLDLLLGKDYIGDPTRDGVLSFSQRVFGENLMPIWLQSTIFEGGDIKGRATRALGEFTGMRAYPISPSQKRDSLRDFYAQKEYGMTWDEVGKEKGELYQNELEKIPELNESTEAANVDYAEGAVGEGKVWTAWKEDGRLIEQIYQQEVSNAVNEFRATNNGYNFKERVQKAADNRSAMYDRREKDSRYKEVSDYFNKPITAERLKKLNYNDFARLDYYKWVYGDDVVDEFNNYDFDKAQERRELFTQQYGQEALDYIEDYSGSKWDKPEELRLLEEAYKVLRPMWGVHDIVAKTFGKAYADSTKGQSLIMKQRQKMRAADPKLAYYYELFYKQ